MVTMNAPATLSERLKIAMAHGAKTHASLAEGLGKARSAVTHWCTGRSEPELEDVARIASALGVRAAWLAFGDGAMVDGDAPSAPPPAGDATATAIDGTPPSAPSGCGSRRRPDTGGQ